MCLHVAVCIPNDPYGLFLNFFHFRYPSGSVPCISIQASIDNVSAPATCSPSHCQNGRYVARVPMAPAKIIFFRIVSPSFIFYMVYATYQSTLLMINSAAVKSHALNHFLVSLFAFFTISVASIVSKSFHVIFFSLFVFSLLFFLSLILTF